MQKKKDYKYFIISLSIVSCNDVSAVYKESYTLEYHVSVVRLKNESKSIPWRKRCLGAAQNATICTVIFKIVCSENSVKNIRNSSQRDPEVILRNMCKRQIWRQLSSTKEHKKMLPVMTNKLNQQNTFNFT